MFRQRLMNLFGTRNDSNQVRNPRKAAPRFQFDQLECRLMLQGDAVLRNGELVVRGTGRGDEMSCELSADSSRVEVTINGGAPQSFALSSVQFIRIRAHAGADVIEISSAIDVATSVHCGRG